MRGRPIDALEKKGKAAPKAGSVLHGSAKFWRNLGLQVDSGGRTYFRHRERVIPRSGGVVA